MRADTVICALECVTYSVCDHFHPNKLVLGPLDVVTVKPQVDKPVAHKHIKQKSQFVLSYKGRAAERDVASCRKCTRVPLSVFSSRTYQ